MENAAFIYYGSKTKLSINSSFLSINLLLKSTMGILNIAMTCKTEINSVFISGIVPRTDKLNEKASKVNSVLSYECNVRNMFYR